MVDVHCNRTFTDDKYIVIFFIANSAFWVQIQIPGVYEGFTMSGGKLYFRL